MTRPPHGDPPLRSDRNPMHGFEINDVDFVSRLGIGILALMVVGLLGFIAGSILVGLWQWAGAAGIAGLAAVLTVAWFVGGFIVRRM